MRTGFLLLGAAIFLMSFTISAKGSANVTVFANVTYPKGVTVDNDGNVYVQSLSLLGDGGLYKFSAAGTLLAVNHALFGDLRLVEDSVNNVIWGIEHQGALYLIDPNTLQAQTLLNLRNVSLPHDSVLNLLTGNYTSLLLIEPVFGDIALHRINSNQFDLFITGQTVSGGIPFVVRLRFSENFQADIVVTSIPWPNPITPPPLDTQPPGIAVNADGTILTELPSNLNGGITPFYFVTFGADFPETNSNLPVFVPAFADHQIYSMGMTSSTLNNGFYVAATSQGFGCGAGPSILYASGSLDTITCLSDLSSFGLGTTVPDDIAVGPDNNFLYVTMSDNNLVLRVPIQYSPTGETNLTPFEPTDWSDKIVVSNTTGTSTDGSSLLPTETLFVDWAVSNGGASDITTSFSTDLYIDGVKKHTWTTSSLQAGYYTYVLDYSIGSLPAGGHEIKIVTDAVDDVSETDEQDNTYTKTIIVQGKNSNAGVLPAIYLLLD